MSEATALKVGNRQVQLSNLAKVLYPSGFTKGEVIEYYARIGPTILGYLKGRALTLKRYPNGTAAPYFYEKNCPSHRPPWLKTSAGPSRDGEGPQYCVMDDVASLLWVANLASVELHVNLSKASTPDRPTSMVFDLDPGAPASLQQCLELGLRLRDRLAKAGLECFAKTSGGKGLHVYVPLNSPRLTFERTKDFARTIAIDLERRDPAKVTSSMSKATRAGKVFVDWSQNARHKTTVCAYSLRAQSSPTVSTPLQWSEVKSGSSGKGLDRLTFTPKMVLERVERLGDLFSPVLQKRQSLPKE